MADTKVTKFACENPKSFCNKMFWDVYAPRFMEKCAAANIPIKSARDFWDAYESATRLEYLEKVQQSTTMHKVAADILRGQMAQAGM